MTVSENHTPSGFDRRTVIRAAAWSAPVIALAAATPLAAASTTPQPAPGGARWQGGTAVSTWVMTEPNFVEVNVDQTVGFNVSGAAPGDYTSGTVTVTVEWGTGPGVSVSSGYRIEETALNGWTRVGALPQDGDSGLVTYVFTGILNGAANIVELPVLSLFPTTGPELTPTYVNTTLSAQYLSTKNSGASVP